MADSTCSRSLEVQDHDLVHANTTNPNLEAPHVDTLKSVGLLELFDTDERPILVFDLSIPQKPVPVYHNASLRELKDEEEMLGTGLLLASMGDWSHNHKYGGFLHWAISSRDSIKLQATKYFGVTWTGQTLRNRWRIIGGDAGKQTIDVQREKTRTHQSIVSGPSSPTKADRSVEEQLQAFRLYRGDTVPVFPIRKEAPSTMKTLTPNGLPTLSAFDLTSSNAQMAISDHIKFFRQYDWASTELGPMSSWSLELRCMVNMLMSDPRSSAMYWGKNRITMYNEAYKVVTGAKHPGMMGKPFLEAWEEVAEVFKPGFDHAYETGTAFKMEEQLFFLTRDGYLEETYYSISMVPFGTSDGISFYNPVIDVTKQVISQRRMSFLLRLGQLIANSQEPKDFWKQLLLGLQPDIPDLPFAIVYSAGSGVNETLSESSEQCGSLRKWVLEGTVRVGDHHTSIPDHLNSEEDLDAFLPDFMNLIKSNSPSILRVKDGSLPPSLAKDLKELGGEISCETALFLPIRSTTESALGFVILGINPRKAFDEDYKLFAELLSRQLTSSLVAAFLFEADRNRLSTKLALTTHENLELEARFRRMADLAPVGMFHLDTLGRLVYANERWFDLTELPRDPETMKLWYESILEEDVHIMDTEWGKLLEGQNATFEIRLKKLFQGEEVVGGKQVAGPTWIIASAYPERAPDGTINGVLGCVTDITRQKWAEDFERRKMLQALEMKRQQENFIDMTSHEMRNPLSAIIQCADQIGTSLAEYDNDLLDVILPREVVDNHAEAAQTIMICAQHQKRIIEDVLTLSKLDSNLLLITPIEVQPVSVIESSLRMFDGDSQKNDIELSFVTESSYLDLGVDWVQLDPSRMLQVLINLVTNAIKFTQSEAERRITIKLGASPEPHNIRNGVEYLPRKADRNDMSVGSAWGSGESVYLYVEVHDSGRGLTEDERTLLFQRFTQASPRTHVQYGGSGLGLFISRELTELQGGRIGVASKTGIGSTFAFCVRARRCTAPEQPEATDHRMSTPPTRLSPRQLSRLAGGNSPSRSPDRLSNLSILGPIHVLVVEDNIVNQKVLAKQLSSAGCTVHVANHGAEALTFLASSRFWSGVGETGVELSLVLMDLEMPVMDGLTCVKEIRKLQEEGKITGHVPVIAVTANARSEQIIIAKEAGMDSVVTKPFRIPELMPVMERLLSKAAHQGSERPAEPERSFSAPH